MPWIFVVLIGHLANAGAFVVDKALLTKGMRHPVVYVTQISMLSSVVLLLIPFGVSWISVFTLSLAAVSGVTFVIGMYAFFSALQRGETTRVVPLLGAFIVLLTIVFSFLLLGETLAPRQWIGIVLLLIGGFLISGEGRKSIKAKLDTKTLLFVMLSAAGFALSSAALKGVFNGVGVVNGFFWTRLFQVLVVFPLFLHPIVRRSFSRKSGQHPPPLFYFGQTMGAIGFLLVAYGIALAPQVSVVNALQGIQYGFLFLLILLLGVWRPGLIREQLTPSIIRQKVFALMLLSAGLVFV